MFAFNSLQRRVVVLLLLPVAVMIAAMGWGAFVYARNSLLSEWREATILKLQRAAHHVDMRLNEAKSWIQMFHRTAGAADADIIQKWLVDQMNAQQGVQRAALIHLERAVSSTGREGAPMMGMNPAGNPWMARWGGMMRFRRARITRVEPPRYNPASDHRTVTLISDLLDDQDKKVGRLEVAVRFNYLTQDVFSQGWGKGEMASLVDDKGNILTCNLSGRQAGRCLEDQTLPVLLREMKARPSGTILGKGADRSRIIGFYRLREAPWTLVLVAGDSQILAPINRFRKVFLVVGVAGVLLTVLLIRALVGRTVNAIRRVSTAARQVADGNYEIQLETSSSDEVGQLIHSFNTMVLQLEERMRLKAAMNLAREVQQNLLPVEAPRIEGLDIAGVSLYCDQTGGDYYDYLPFSAPTGEVLGIAVGDVAGHGIPAALLMTTVRAMLRTRLLQPGDLAQVAADVNRLLCQDTERTGDFMTLFLLAISAHGKTFNWVRAGHPPALIYHRDGDRFETLSGQGSALGFLESSTFSENAYHDWDPSKLLVLGTDGIWETENPQGEMFGMERFRNLIRRTCDRDSRTIVEAVLDELRRFRQTAPQTDDITLVVVKGR